METDNDVPIVDPDYFRTLPTDVLRLVIRQVSSSPREPSWRSSINGTLFLSADGPFKDVVPALVSHVTLRHPRQGREIPDSSVPLSVLNDAEFIEASLQAFGRFLHAFTIDSFPRAATHGSRILLNSFLSNCIRVRELTISCDAASIDWQLLISSLFTKLGPQLRSLKLAPQSGFEATMSFSVEKILANCRRLRKISLVFPKRVSIATALPLWDGMGDTLREVDIQADYRYPNEVENHELWPQTICTLRDRCRRVHSFRLDTVVDQGLQQRMFADLFSTAGKKLRYCDIYYMGTQSCSKIARACPNLKCTLNIRGHQWREICALGARVETLNISAERNVNPDEFSRIKYAILLCKELKTLKVTSGLSDFDVYDIFNAKMESLTHLEFDTSASFLSSEAMKGIAKHTCNLETLVIRAALFDDSRDFASIATSNLNLQHVSIEQLMPTDNHINDNNAKVLLDMAICDIMDAFVGNTMIKSFSITMRRKWMDMAEIVEERFTKICAELKRRERGSAVLKVNGKVM